jgi:hypothetical protein
MDIALQARWLVYPLIAPSLFTTTNGAARERDHSQEIPQLRAEAKHQSAASGWHPRRGTISANAGWHTRSLGSA